MRILTCISILFPFVCSCLSGPDLRSREDLEQIPGESQNDVGNMADVGGDKNGEDGGGIGRDGGELHPDDGGYVPPLTDGGVPQTDAHLAEGPPLQCRILYPVNIAGQMPIGERIQVGCTHDSSAPQEATFSYQVNPVMGNFTPSGYGEFIWQVTTVPPTFTDTRVTLTVTAIWPSPTPLISKAEVSIDLIGNVWVAVQNRGVVAMGSDGTNQGDAIAGLHLPKAQELVQSADGHTVYATQREAPWISAFAFSDRALRHHFSDNDGSGPIWDLSNYPLGVLELAERNQVWVTGLEGKIAIFNLAGAFLRYQDLGFTPKSGAIAHYGHNQVIVAENMRRIVHLIPLGEGQASSYMLEYCGTDNLGGISSMISTPNGYYFGVRHGTMSYPFLFSNDLSCLAGAEHGNFNATIFGLALLGDRLVVSMQTIAQCLAQYDAHTFERHEDLCPLAIRADTYGLLKVKSPQ